MQRTEDGSARSIIFFSNEIYFLNKQGKNDRKLSDLAIKRSLQMRSDHIVIGNLEQKRIGDQIEK